MDIIVYYETNTYLDRSIQLETVSASIVPVVLFPHVQENKETIAYMCDRISMSTRSLEYAKNYQISSEEVAFRPQSKITSELLSFLQNDSSELPVGI